jgi:hypothetical protein
MALPFLTITVQLDSTLFQARYLAEIPVFSAAPAGERATVMKKWFLND